MAANSGTTGLETFRLFASDEKTNPGLGFLNFSETPSPPPPPCVEVLSTEVSSSVKYFVEPVKLGELTFMKGRVSTQEVFALSNSDLIPGKYEGGLKLWEGSLDLIRSLCSEVQNGHLSMKGKRVLELGCGHGLPGIFACLEGAALIHFQDFNAEVLQCLTIPNVYANISKDDQTSVTKSSEWNCKAEVRFFSGDWREVHKLLRKADNEKGTNSSGVDPTPGYDIILMAETVYSTSNLQALYDLIKKCMSRPYGVTYMAAKKHYFGVGGGSRRFLSVVEKGGVMAAELVAEVTDGSSNVREVWKLSFK
ncbi:uncharacterized protein LOC131160296 isoform X2 [Malania oleifera]|uniref:uncharacterized protein LOC131160296 isoform X2 n=1 Tax=Malania oleifera TaxID=397392 RepID=UPI0025ADF4CA|nr:uncharacterized protein LOC131160296 isoform X2 [Malania oleifera]